MLCPAPWIGMQLSPEGASPCCVYKKSSLVSSEKIHSFDDVMYSKEFKQLRYNMANDIVDSNCEQCYKEEKNGQKSRRQYLLDNYNTDTIAIQDLEVIFDNVCNLKCRGCNSGGSHLWVKDELDIYGTLIHEKKLHNLKFDNYDLSKINNLSISGGEPLLSKSAENFISHLEIQNVELSVVTNATITPGDVFLNAFNKCKKLNIAVSIDGYGSLNDFYRTNSNFEDIKTNLDIFYQYFTTRQDFGLEIITTVNVYNINMLNELEEFLNSYPLIKWTLKPLEFPMFLSIRYLPTTYKQELKKIVKQQHLLDMLEHNEDYFEHFVNFHKKLEKRKQKLPNEMLQKQIDNYKLKNNSQDFFDMQMEIFKNELS